MRLGLGQARFGRSDPVGSPGMGQMGVYDISRTNSREVKQNPMLHVLAASRQGIGVLATHGLGRRI